MFTLFVSDLHLDPERPQTTAIFLDLLRTRARSAEAFYVLGDLFEAWVGDDDPEPAYAEVIAGLRSLVSSGVPVTVMHGNRDFLLGDAFAAASGCRLLAEPARISLYGVPTLLMHGDTLCTKDTAYQEFRRRLRDTNWLAQFRAKPLVERKRLAAEFRFRSRLATQEKPEEITDVDPTAVAERMREHGVQRLIHGHTHRPALHRFELDGQSVERLVLGDWYRQGSLLTCTPQGCRLDGLGPGAIATVDGESCATN